mmetsp:Transcript_14935/g.26170  ORF Transcript_14935/g.26170 Transcript_14935/m.26170 type:complete len:422 (-) Transcript_14935:30-1295(-)
MFSVIRGLCGNRRPSVTAVPMTTSSSASKSFAESVLTESFWQSRSEKRPEYIPDIAAELANEIGLDDVVSALVTGARPQLGSTAAFKRGEPCPRENFYMAYLDNATLSLENAEHFLPGIFAICKELETAFGFVSARLVLDPPEYSGPPLSADADLLCLQLIGEQNLSLIRPMAGLPVSAPRPKPMLETTLKAGDAVYVPVGVDCRQMPNKQSPSLYALFTLQSSEQSLDLSLSKFLTDLLLEKSQLSAESDEFFRHAVTKAMRPDMEGEKPGPEAIALDANLQKAASDLLSKVTAKSLRSHFDTRMQKLREEQRQGSEQVRAAPQGPPRVTSKSILRIARGVQCRCLAGSSSVQFTRGHETMSLNISPTASALLERLSDGKDHAVESLPCEDPMERICVSQIMLNKACFELAGDFSPPLRR